MTHNTSTQSQNYQFHESHTLTGPHVITAIERLEADSIEIDEMSELLNPEIVVTEMIFAEAATVAQQRHFQREIRSLKHAIQLLGLSRVHSVLSHHLSELLSNQLPVQPADSEETLRKTG